MNSLPIRSIFEQWWRDSYGLTPGGHAIMTHVAFAEHLLDLIHKQQLGYASIEALIQESENAKAL